MGDITGGVTILNNLKQGTDEWHTNKLLSIFHYGEALGQTGVMIFGGEEVEVIYNLGSMAVDHVVDSYDK